MKRKAINEIRQKDLKELVKDSEIRRTEIAKTSAEMKGGKEKNLKKVKNLRRDLSQVLTVIREKEYMISENKDKEGKEEASREQ